MSKDDDRIDHIGWRLWNAATAWKAQFADAMVAAGHGWYAEARSSIIPYIEPGGTRQSDIARQIGLSKQAVQQLVDDLEQEGIVCREPDPDDGRAKVVLFTDKGLAAQRDANRIKRRIEAKLRRELGDEDFDRLYVLLDRVARG